MISLSPILPAQQHLSLSPSLNVCGGISAGNVSGEVPAPVFGNLLLESGGNFLVESDGSYLKLESEVA